MKKETNYIIIKISNKDNIIKNFNSNIRIINKLY